MKLHINEMFESIQGEGRYVGTPAFFIRLQGCNLTCAFCDTKYTWKTGGEKLAIQQALNDTKGHKHIVITGGEPLLQERELFELIYRLRELKIFIEVETNGTIFPETLSFRGLDVQYNVSPKIDFMDEAYRTALLRWNGLCDFKFVIRNERDLVDTMMLVKDLKLKNVFVMPEGILPEMMIEDTRWLVERVKHFKLQWRVVPRLHVLLYGNERRK